MVTHGWTCIYWKIRQYRTVIEAVMRLLNAYAVVKLYGSGIHQSARRFGEESAVGEEQLRPRSRHFVEAVCNDEHRLASFILDVLNDLIYGSNDLLSVRWEFQGLYEIIVDIEFD